MVAEAHRRHPRLAVQEEDAEALPFAKGAFDAVAMNFGVLHLGQLEQAFAEAYCLSYRLSAISRWLKPGYSFFRLPTSDLRRRKADSRCP
jgi:ubiquinone/menaquinone biosynthesis C-methylase UbiE